MSIVVFVGTDTEVGKTYVLCRTIEALRTRGRDLVAVKPVESGCMGTNEDGVAIAEAAGQTSPNAALVRLSDPVTPALAAEHANVLLQPSEWVESIRELDAKHELVLVEGAGGVLSPMTWTYNAIDLITQLDGVCVLVSANRLGTINHTMLTLRALDTARLDTLGIAVSTPKELDGSSPTNIDALRRLDPRPMCSIERDGGADEVANWITKHLDGVRD